MRTACRWKRPRSCSPPSTAHEDQTSTDIRKIVEPYIRQALPAEWINDKTVWHINPTGSFVIGGPDGDCGLTGRKIIVDTYGGAAPHGGGAFSGKDSTKVDRSAAYAARYLAKNVVASGLADRCTIQLAYAIGVAEPLSVYVDTHGTGKVDEAKLEKILPQLMNLKPRGIREHLDLNKPIYARTSAYGHFGREPDSRGRLLLGEDRPGRPDQSRGLKLARDVASREQRYGLAPYRSHLPMAAGNGDHPERCPPQALWPPQGSQAVRPAGGLRRTLLAKLAFDPRQRSALRPVSEQCSKNSGWRSASAPASIWSGRPRQHSDVGLIGAEPYEMGVAKLLTKLEETPLNNVRMYEGDGRDIIEALPDASLGRFFLLFPDPWPKTRHHKRRFLQMEMLDSWPGC